MSEEEALSRKEKKARRDAERAQQKGKKRKHREVAEPDALPEQDGDEDAKEPGEVASAKHSKKRKVGEIFEDTTADAPLPTDKATAEARPKKKRQKSNAARKATTKEDETPGETPSKPTKSRFIVFVGNLPFQTTDSSLQKHFAKLQPFTLRHRTDPKTGKSKGFAFLEFENYDRMKTCLKIYHHSMFDPEAIDSGKVEGGPDAGAVMVTGSNADDGMHPDRRNGGAGRKKKETARKINVELTAGGGGGKSDGRKEKIKEKNVRLNEQRERRAELEKKEKVKKDAKAQKGGKKETKGKKEEKKKEVVVVEKVVEVDTGIHPARLAMMGR